MGCCGSLRQRLYKKKDKAKDGVQTQSQVHDTSAKDRKEVFFQYVGKTGITVIAPISGMKYRFIGHGAVMSVDPKDLKALTNVPNLRQVRPVSRQSKKQ